MSADHDMPRPVETLLATRELAEALESEQFRRFLDHIPVAVVVAKVADEERIVYANPDSSGCPARIAPPSRTSPGACWPASARVIRPARHLAPQCLPAASISAPSASRVARPNPPSSMPMSTS
ncbi:PAS domain-containing protein [Siccirubricoccus deserti]